MASRLRRLTLVLPILLALIVGTAAAPAPTVARTGYSRDVYFSAGYERQVDGRTCIAASTAMMVNFIAHRDLDLDQLAILRYAQRRDALNDRVQRGSDPLGWARAATAASGLIGQPTEYSWQAFGSEYAALRRAASQIARYGKPVGLLVQHGRHAVVMTGFKATRDPNRGSFRLTHVYVSDPLGARHILVKAANSPLDRYLELDATPRFDHAWYGRYVIVAPQN